MSIAKYIRCKPCLIATSTIVVGAIVFLIINRNKKKKMIDQINALLDGNVPDQGQKVISDTDYAALPTGTFPIKIGQKNKKVYDIQKALNQFKGSHLDLDGVYGESTWKVICDKWWTVCRDLTPGKTFGDRRNITQTDYDAIVNNKMSFSGAEPAIIVEAGRNEDIMKYASN